MKNGILISIVLFLFTQNLYAQFDWGIKGGLNFASPSDIQLFNQDLTIKTDDNTGYHIGVFTKIKVSRFYLRPELIYTSIKSSYQPADFTTDKLDLPVLLGIKIIKPISLIVGPSLHYWIHSDFDVLELDDFDKDLTTGFHIGLAAEIGFVGLDARYERGFSNNLADFSNINAQIVTNSEQFTVSAFVKF